MTGDAKTPQQNGQNRAPKKRAARPLKGKKGDNGKKAGVDINKAPSFIVGMGASAGGLEALEAFFQNMPPDSGMAFIIVLHLSPEHKSIMPELIQRHSGMNVFQAEDGIRVEPNNVYVVPPKRYMAIMQTTLQLMEADGKITGRLPIDFFLRSLAQDQQERAICIIFSGTGTDGSLGLKEIKAKNGMAMVQDLDSAKYDGMVRSALETGGADFILPPQQMPVRLMEYAKHPRHGSAKGHPPSRPARPDDIKKILLLIRNHTGHDFSGYKQNTIVRRIQRRMEIHQIERVQDYIRYLQQATSEIEVLFKNLLIGVTGFFRDPHAFESLKGAIIESLKNKPMDYTFRVWVPGCSTGEEVYTLAIILWECLDEKKMNTRFQIFGTDIDEEAIATARSGRYPEGISADISQARLKRFFRKEGNYYHIHKELRQMAIFAVQDISKDPPFTKLDLLCCRNLLIYLDADLQKRLMPLFHYALKPEGILFLGSSETIGGYIDSFSSVDKKWKIFQSRALKFSRQSVIPFNPMPPFRHAGKPNAQEVHTIGAAAVNIAECLQNLLLKEFAPSCVLIDETGTIHYFYGRTGRYLEPAPGKAALNIFEMAREGLQGILTSAIRNAITQKKDVRHEHLEIKTNGGVQTINLYVKPLSNTENLAGFLLVAFEDVASQQIKGPGKKKGKRSDEATDRHIEELENELRYTRESLQSSIEELETTNEELKSSNEELQSTNEELQSTNEELETSKEELQSLNEELTTVNAELQGRIEELAQINSDMKNLMESTQVASIFLDSQLCIKRFTAPATKIINLIHADIGRPLEHILSNLVYQNLTEDAAQVLKALAFKEIEVKTKEGYWYFMRIMPYWTTDNVIDGVVITFIDINAQKVAAEKSLQLNRALKEANEYSEGIIDTVHESIIVLDKSLRIISCNRSFCTSFQLALQEVKGRFIYEIGKGHWDIPRLRELLEDIIPKSTFFEGFEVEHDFPKTGYRKMVLNARRIYQNEKGTEMILLAMEDKTGERCKDP